MKDRKKSRNRFRNYRIAYRNFVPKKVLPIQRQVIPGMITLILISWKRMKELWN